jgi:ribonucleoside-diphosphate reductase alpha chain
MTRVHQARPPREARIFDDVLPADLPRPELTDNARLVLERRYLKKDATGKPTELPEVMFWRVAKTIADVDRDYGASASAVDEVARQFYDLMIHGTFEPNSPTLMNAGRPLGQLSACFVLPVDDAISNGQSGIYDTLRAMALVHQSGGGCVAGDAHVHTSFCGIETIQTLYERVRTLGVEEIVASDHTIMDVRHLGIRTLALDPSSGAFRPNQVTHLWRWNVPADQQYRVRCTDGSEVTTSAWHPFMVFTEEGVVERRTDALRAGDLLLKPNRTVRDSWPFTESKQVAGLSVGEELAWLAGYFLGDGSLDVFRNRAHGYEALRLRFFDGRSESIRFAASVLERHGVKVTPHQDNRGLWRLTTTDQSFVPKFAQVVEACPGAKHDLTLPEWVGKSPLKVIAAFLGGLVDSDAYVGLDRRRVEYSTCCPRLARRLTSLMSTLGFDPAHRTKEPTGKGRRVEHRVQLANAKKTHELAALIGAWVHDSLRGTRLARLAERVVHNTHDRIPLPFAALRPLLEAAGVDVSSSDIHRCPIVVDGEYFWLHRTRWGLGIGEDKLQRLVCALRRVLPSTYAPRLEQLERLADGWALVEASGPTTEPKSFFDFTVEGFNTYLAGGGDGRMLVIHNTGFSFSRLRPEGETVRSTMGVASGPVSFMKLYDASTDVVKQGGTRRGANMGILRVDHPDIRKFITCKNDTTQITNFNISVAITDAFMEAVKNDAEYDLINPKTREIASRENAREIFDMIIHGAWLTGEPGTFFIDRANEDNPVPKLGEYEATNPCGEQVLLPYDVCNLGSINLGAFVKPEARWGDAADQAIDWEGLARVVHLSTHFLDNVIDANVYPLPEIHDLAQKIRRIGLGVMGWADMLVRLGVPYDSNEAIALAREVMAFVNEQSRVESQRLAESRGVFPAWRGSIWGPDRTAARRRDGSRIRPALEVRNCNLTTVAPTGTISIFAGCSGGIEPLFAVAFMRNQAGALMPDVNPDFVRIAKQGGWYSDDLMERIAAEGHIHFAEVPAEVQRVFHTAHDISPEWHVRMQAAFQEHVDAGISKTTNFPREATEQDVREIYELAFDLGCKGVTVYRDGSREGQVLSTGKTAQTEMPAQVTAHVSELEHQLADEREENHRKDGEIERLRAELQERDLEAGAMRRKRQRPLALRGYTMKMNSPLGDLYVTINEDERGRPFEVFCTLGKAGGAAMADAEAMGRLMSLALRSGISIQQVKEQVRGISCDRAVGLGPNKVLSVPDAVGQAIERYLEEKAGVQEALPLPAMMPAPQGGRQPQASYATSGGESQLDIGTCPECGTGHMAFEEGCKKCHVCGYSECG